MRRGEIYWADLGPPSGRRRVVLVTRTAAIAVRTRVTIAPVTTRIRDAAFEVRVGRKEGLQRPSVVSCDNLATIPKATLVSKIGALGPSKRSALDRALRFALGIGG